MKPLPTKKRHKKSHALVLPKFDVLPDGAHAVTVPVHTRNHANSQTPNSRGAAIMRARERAAQREVVAKHLFGIGVSFRGVTLVRLAPSTGLDTGGLWNALKAAQDEVASHLGVDDGPKSAATWRMEQERSKEYGVRVVLRMERADAVVTKCPHCGGEIANEQGVGFAEVGT
jgi:hypothetical protein